MRHAGHDLRLGGGSLLGDKLHPELRELAGLAAQARLLANHRGAVAQARRQVSCPQTPGNEARHGKREVRAEHEQRLIGVKELEG